MSQNLRVSVGICAYNEEKNIGRLIENLLNQPIGNHELTEIIVVASGCTDETVSVVQAMCNKNGKLKLIVEPTRNGKVAAVNRLLKTYQGDVLVHVDADHHPSQGSFQLLLDRFNDPSVGAVSGCQIPFNGNRFMDRLNVVVWGLHNETQKYYNHREAAQHLGGVLFAIRRGICGHVPEDVVNDDAYMGIQCKRKGYRVYFEDAALAYFQGPRKLHDYIIQRRRVVYGHLKVKRQTGITPMVLEMCPLKDKIAIISCWIRKNWRLIPYLLAACLLELYVNILAKFDMLKKENPHRIWKVAVTTKMPVYSLMQKRKTRW